MKIVYMADWVLVIGTQNGCLLPGKVAVPTTFCEKTPKVAFSVKNLIM
jgi:hypothetical protein